MKTRFAVLPVLLWTAPFFLAGDLAAEEHKTEAKAEHKVEPAKKEGKEAKDAKPTASHSEGKGEAKAEAKHEAKPEPPHEAKPSPVAAEHAAPLSARRAPRMPIRPSARAARSRAAAPVVAALRPAIPPSPAPVVVQVKQEPARVEAFLHVVPYGQAPGVPAFAGSGYGSPGQYTIAAVPASPGNAPPAAESAAPNSLPADTTVSTWTPAVSPSIYPPQAPAPQAPVRNVLRVSKNALTNEGLVTLAQVGYDEDFILDLMRQKNCRFDTSVDGLAYMATHGLTERIVKAALKADAENQLAQQLEARR